MKRWPKEAVAETKCPRLRWDRLHQGKATDTAGAEEFMRLGAMNAQARAGCHQARRTCGVEQSEAW